MNDILIGGLSVIGTLVVFTLLFYLILKVVRKNQGTSTNNTNNSKPSFLKRIVMLTALVLFLYLIFAGTFSLNGELSWEQNVAFALALLVIILVFLWPKKKK